MRMYLLGQWFITFFFVAFDIRLHQVFGDEEKHRDEVMVVDQPFFRLLQDGGAFLCRRFRARLH